MRQINLNGVQYEIKGEISHRAINPWKAAITSGGREYDSFQNCDLKEYHDFRNGIGLESALPSESARTWWTEGIDFSSARSAVLGPLVTTTTFGVAPVKIIDFQDKTYAIGSEVIKVWDTTESVWRYVAHVIETCEDKWDAYENSKTTQTIDTDKKVGTYSVKIQVDSATVGEMLAIETIGSKDMTDYSKVGCWIKSELGATAGQLQLHLCSGLTWTSPTSAVDPDTQWTDEDLAWDEGVGAGAYDSVVAQNWGSFLQLLRPAINCDRVRFYLQAVATAGDEIDVDVYYGSAWHHVYEGTYAHSTWITKFIPAGTQSVTKMQVKFFNNHATDGQNIYLNEVDFGAITTETINLPILTADTWMDVMEDITTPANLGTVTEIGIKSVADLGTEPYDIRIDDVRITETLSHLASPLDAIVVTDQDDEYLVVSAATTAVYWDGGATTSFTTLSTVRGYLAWYDTYLWGITTDGKTMYRSAANNIDGAGDNFTLSGDFGTVYDLFEGKLLADGTPTIYFCGTEGLFTVNTTTETAYKQEVEYPPLTYAGHKGLYWNANVWVATGFGILKVTPSMATFVGPDQDDGLPSTYHGSIFDMVAVNNWLVYCVNKTSSSDKSSILKRNSSYGGSLQVYTSAADDAITCLLHSPSSMYAPGRLWFGEETDIKYIMFPDTTSNVKQVSTYQYVDGSGGTPYSQLPIFRSLAAIPKVALGVAAITKSCTEVSTHDETIEVYYGLNGASPVTHLGDFTTSPRPTLLTFNSGLGYEFYTIQFAIKLTRGGTNTWSPELESLLFYYYAVPTRVSAWTFNVDATGEYGDAIFTAFEAIQDTVILVAFYPSGDTAKTKYNVKLTNMPSREWFENQGKKQGYFQCTVAEVFKG